MGHEAEHTQASQGPGLHLPASSQTAATAAGAFLSVRPPRPLCPSEKKKTERGASSQGAPGCRVCSWGRPQAWEIGGSGACFAMMAGQASHHPFPRGWPGVPQHRRPGILPSICSSLLGNTNKHSAHEDATGRMALPKPPLYSLYIGMGSFGET